MKKITKPGVYKNLTYEEYDLIPAIRSTYLKKMLHCPAMTQETDDEETAALKFGVAAHVGVLEGMNELDKRYVVMPKFDGDKRTSAYKELKKATVQLAEIQKKTILAYEDYEDITGIRKNIFLHPTAKDFIRSEPELTVVWKDQETGFLLKARLDGEPFDYHGTVIIPDLKTTVTASEGGFANEIKKHRYYLSAGMYWEGASLALKKKIEMFVIVAVEKKRPYKVEVHGLSEAYMEYGRIEFHKALRKEAECRKRGFYPPWINGGMIVQEKPSYLVPE